MIPLLDLNDTTFDQDFISACADLGFVAITGHNLTDLFAPMRALMASLFSGDLTDFQITPDNYRGWIPLGFFTPNRAEINGRSGDQYEGYKLHWECPAGHPVQHECDLYGPNRWVPRVPEMEPTVTEYWQGCDALAAGLLGIIATALDINVDQFLSWHGTPLTNMTLLHYPAQPPASAAMGIHPHKDTNVITFLHPDPVGGLEVRSRGGDWIEVATPPDALLINTGEMLEIWSGGRFAATPHRVINRSGRERYAFPYFVVPNHDVVVEPLLPCVEDFAPSPMPVGKLSAEVWRTNWPDAVTATPNFDLGSLR